MPTEERSPDQILAEAMDAAINQARKEGQKEGFRQGVEYMTEKYVFVDKGKFVEWAQSLVGVVKELEFIDEAADAVEGLVPAAEPEPAPAPAPKPKPKPKPKGKMTITPEEERSIEQMAESMAKKSSVPDDVNWD